MASDAFSWSLDALDIFCRHRGSRISSLFKLVSGRLSERPKPAKPCMDVRNFFCFFCGVWRIFVNSGFVGKSFVVCFVGLSFHPFFALVSGRLSERPKPAKPSMDVRNFFRFFCGVWRIFVSSELVGELLCLRSWSSNFIVFCFSF